MAFMNTINIIGSGLTAQQLRLDIVSENVTNSQTTRVENGEGAYRRKMVVFEAEGGRNSFRRAMADAAVGASNRGAEKAGGVKVTDIIEDESDFPISYDPTHPDANDQGYLEMPNVILVKEITDAMAATQAYSANVTAFSTLKTVIARGLELGSR